MREHKLLSNNQLHNLFESIIKLNTNSDIIRPQREGDIYID